MIALPANEKGPNIYYCHKKCNLWFFSNASLKMNGQAIVECCGKTLDSTFKDRGSVYDGKYRFSPDSSGSITMFMDRDASMQVNAQN